jgi:hypothetical protein
MCGHVLSDGEKEPGQEDISREVIDALARRERLRECVTTALSRQLSGLDVAAFMGIGLIGALPSLPHDILKIPAILQPLARVVAQFRTALDGPIGQAVLSAALTEQAMPDIKGILEALHSHSSGVGWLGARIAESASSLNEHTQLLVPESVDVFGTAGTGLLAKLLCQRKGWHSDEQVYHEAFALAYAVNAIASAWFNPNPLSFALAAWHGVKALKTSSKMTAQIDELVKLAVSERQRLVGVYDAAVCTSKVVDALVTTSLGSSSEKWDFDSMQQEQGRFVRAIGNPGRRGDA